MSLRRCAPGTFRQCLTSEQSFFDYFMAQKSLMRRNPSAISEM
uniref:Uncharacterized protein n=1 Tax=Anguilla anguilla TaxID=7936 RepID=A0A0E9SIH3_ANGAN